MAEGRTEVRTRPSVAAVLAVRPGETPVVTPPPADAAVVRRVRLRLLLLSGGSTLVVLLALGLALYLSVASSLSAAAVDQLRARATFVGGGFLLRSSLPGAPFDVLATVPQEQGVAVGGPTSGTLAFIVGPEGVELPNVVGARVANLLGGQIAPTGLALARLGATAVTETEVNGTPVRVLSQPIERPEGTFVVQVVGDRTAELRTLQVLLIVLLVGGLAAIGAAVGFGWLYADRALVPIRDALRRQREFAADASHELRTPLAVVRASIDHLRRHADEPVATVGTALTDIEAEVGRLTSLVDELLVLARSDSGTLEVERVPLDLAEVVLDAGPSLDAMASAAGVGLVVDAAPVRVLGDKERLRQLVTILVDNAVRHAPRGGHVRVTAIPDAGGALLRVDDDGPGVRPEHLPHVFDRFWRAPDAPPGGTGLGLAIAAHLAQRHGGSITAANGPDGGARFDVRLPADPSRG